jgi:lysophospholipase L1-like esterase
LDRLASLKLSGGQIREAARQALERARWVDGREATLADYFAAAASQTGGDLGTLAQKITPIYGWGDIVLPDDPTARWDHARYVPDAIGVELGQNDFSTGIPDQVEYVTAYVQFVEKLRRDAPQAVIFLMQSPMQSDQPNADDARRAALRACLTQVVARVHSPKVMLAPVRYHPGVPGNGHPSGADHVAMADELEPLFRKALGW